MAKNAIKTFPVKVDIDEDIKLITTEFGQVGFAVIVHLYRFIHSKGYYSGWSRDVGLLFIQEFCQGVGWGLVSEIVECAVRRGVFDSELYQKHTILTSKEIQETYLKATSRQKSVKFHKNYALPVVYDFIANVDINRKNAYIFDENVDTFLQAKVKVKVKDIKGYGAQRPSTPIKTDFIPPTLAEVQAYCKENSLGVDSKQFFDYYTAGGWRDKEGKFVVSWQQKLITWAKFDKDRAQIKASSNGLVQRGLSSGEMVSGRSELTEEEL